ncbi:MAG: TerB family tellurite resistance protein [Cyanothece sp. SIO1E1]|nr:TerB family tellurite resistance protein [Cyanothece sp. SIO1E1]
MVPKPPPPPSISPRQMTLLRIVASMAWSDGDLAAAEVDLMLDRFSRLFLNHPDRQQQLRQELQDYLAQNIPLEELTPKLATAEERELVLKLGYEVISSSARTPDEANINAEEALAYQRLIQLLDLPPNTVERIEAEAQNEMSGKIDLVDILTRQLRDFIQN